MRFKLVADTLSMHEKRAHCFSVMHSHEALPQAYQNTLKRECAL